jgi:hypothetical protein
MKLNVLLWPGGGEVWSPDPLHASVPATAATTRRAFISFLVGGMRKLGQ